MNLKQLKLAGFKSFVDPTVVTFPSQLVAVVGPNGCGKSNIIDAVRWVMGESSAKALRGDSMADVIFNGSSNRKAVGQASVELIFDNSFGKLTGQYGSYQEIAVKRLVTRDGDSHYFLNGARCRRSDISDLFLGTGAGSKGYSIIGQGTVSKLIEAKPEELRAYLEEAAGISKYKERRKETLSRINHTRDNLARVADVRDELDKQLQRLERQAKTAERYQILKEEEAIIKAEILALKWQALQDEQRVIEQNISSYQIECEKHQAEATRAYQHSVSVREQQHALNDNFQSAQANYYQLTTEIARLEENLQQQQREKQRLLGLQQQLQHEWQNLTSQQQQDQEAQQHNQQTQQQLSQQINTLGDNLRQKEIQFTHNQQQYEQWQAHYNANQMQLQKALNEQQMQQLNLQHLSQRRQEIQARIEVISQEQQQLDIQSLDNKLQALQQQAQSLKQQSDEEESRYQQQTNQAKDLAQQLQEVEKSIRTTQDQGYQLHTRLAATTTILQTALGRQQDQHSPWQQHKRLVENLQVDARWQPVCEMVLHEALHAVVVDSWSAVHQDLPAIRQDLTFVLAQKTVSSARRWPTLADKIQGDLPTWPVCLDKIFTADNLEEALTWLSQIDADESVVTVEGYWLGQGFLKVKCLDEPDPHSLLAHQQELHDVKQQVEQCQQRLADLTSQRDEYHQLSLDQEEQLATLRHQLAISRELLRACQVDMETCQRLIQQTQDKQQHLSAEYESLMHKLETNASEHDAAEVALQKIATIITEQEQEQQQLTATKALHYDNLVLEKNEVEQLRAALHQQELLYTREQFQGKQLEERLQRSEFERQRLSDQVNEVSEQLLVLENPDNELHHLLQQKMTQQQELDGVLINQREQLNDLSQQLDTLTAQIKIEEKNTQQIQTLIQKQQMEEQAVKVRASTLVDALNEVGMQAVDMLRLMPQDMTVALREQALLEVVAKINRLGAINLAAIEEYEQQSERKNYLDRQYHDLNEAIAALETAIEKMDKETRQRFQATFDEVNTAFQALFPRLFGGGNATLALNCDNLLEAGVLVMVQPPGKRNSTIHLLSGGEKAMTAVALIFAIFQLNPSPFCLLDEVDAPLDDVNIGRFCTLVKEMSQFVQFLFITHNKITMELADHLIGVTMREPGVSRLVAVDVEQALSMSES